MPEALGATLTQELRSDLSGSIDRNLNRPTNLGAFNLFKKQSDSNTGILSRRTKELIDNSVGNTVKVPYLSADDITIKNYRECKAQVGGSKSGYITLTFGTYSFGFHMIPFQYRNNDIGYEEDFKRKLEKGIWKFGKALDTLFIGVLETNKNQYFPSAVTKFYPETGDAFRVPQASKEYFYNRASGIMRTMDFDGNTDVITTEFGLTDIRHWNNQGQANDENLAYQFGSYSFWSSNRITDGSGVESTHYLVAQDSVAMRTRTRGINTDIGNKRWDSDVVVPILNIPMDLYTVVDCVDASTGYQDQGMSSAQQVPYESYEYSVDITTAVRYNPDPSADYSPIVKAEFLT